MKGIRWGRLAGLWVVITIGVGASLLPLPWRAYAVAMVIGAIWLSVFERGGQRGER